MKYIAILAGAAALGFAGPALAKPGHGNGHAMGYAYGYAGNGHADEHASRGMRYDDDEADEIDEGIAGRPLGYGVGGCPPGLAKKNPPCVPPGLSRQQAGPAGALGYARPYGVPVPYTPYGAYGAPVYGQAAPGYAYPYGAAPVPYGAYGGAYGAPYYGYGYPQADPRSLAIQQLIGALVR